MAFFLSMAVFFKVAIFSVLTEMTEFYLLCGLCYKSLLGHFEPYGLQRASSARNLSLRDDIEPWRVYEKLSYVSMTVWRCKSGRKGAAPQRCGDSLTDACLITGRETVSA
jgi:hypothetical protein